MLSFVNSIDKSEIPENYLLALLNIRKEIKIILSLTKDENDKKSLIEITEILKKIINKNYGIINQSK